MTVRGICMIFLALAGTAVGLLAGRSALALLSLAVLLWMMAEWAWFHWNILTNVLTLTATRHINNRSDDSLVVFAGRTLRVELSVESPHGRIRPWTRLRDVLPDLLALVDGDPEKTVVESAQQIIVSYACRARAAGLAHLPGVRVRVQDANGFFEAERFVPCSQTLRLLPTFDSSISPVAGIKRLNGLPQHGIHRVDRAGMGSELLEIREYVPGDPPKSIAWKVSARRDRLMTREYESEVPIRTTIFVEDTDRTRRRYWGDRPCDFAAKAAASLVQTALSAGDPAGLVLYSEDGVKRLPPAWGDRMLYRVLERLAETCRLQPGDLRWSPRLQQHAFNVCREHYPHLLDTRVNQVPFSIFPLLPWNRTIHRTRFQLAGVVGEVYGLTTAECVRLVFDDQAMGHWLSRLLSDTGRPFEFASERIPGELFGSAMTPETSHQLGRALRQSVSQAKDNEHYIVVCDLLETFPTEALRPAIQLARARHHRVGVICMLPPARSLSGNGDEPPTSESLLHEAWHIELHERRRRLTQEIRSSGADIAFADQDRPLSLVMADLHLAHSGRAMAGGFR